MDLLNQLNRYTPVNEQETEDKKTILACLEKEDNIFLRDNKLSHMTASAWVVNHTRDKILMVYHNLYDSWSWMGGHADGEKNLLKVAEEEILEESGLSRVKVLSSDIFSLEVLTVDGHIKKGHYVPSHLHLNVTYLFEADDTLPLSVKPDENSDVAWFPLEDGVNASSEPWFRNNVYTKLNKKLKQST